MRENYIYFKKIYQILMERNLNVSLKVSHT